MLEFLLQTLSQQPEWEGMPSGEKLLKIMTQFNYKAYGNELIGIALKAVQETLLPSEEVTKLRDFITQIEAAQRGTELGVKSALEVVGGCITTNKCAYRVTN